MLKWFTLRNKDGLPNWFVLLTELAAAYVTLDLFLISSKHDWLPENPIFVIIMSVICTVQIIWYLSVRALRRPLWPRKT
jgi:hypothetical protein